MIAFQVQQHDLDQFQEWKAEVGTWAVYMPVSKVYYFMKTEEEAKEFIALHEDNRRYLTSTYSGAPQ